MKIYIGCEDGDHNAIGLISFDEAGLEAWLVADLSFTPGEPSLTFAKAAITQALKEAGVYSLLTNHGTTMQQTHEVIAAMTLK